MTIPKIIPMSSTTKTKAYGATPGKLALIAVLAVVLVVVLAIQFGSGQAGEATQETTATDRKPAARRVPAARGPQLNDAKAPTKARGAPWPVIESTEVAQYDPFALTEPFAPFEPKPSKSVSPQEPVDASQDALAEQRRAALAQLRQTGVTAIVRTPHGHVAAIGDRLVQVGDIVDGFRVTKITSDGLTVEVAASNE